MKESKPGSGSEHLKIHVEFSHKKTTIIHMSTYTLLLLPIFLLPIVKNFGLQTPQGMNPLWICLIDYDDGKYINIKN